MQKSADSILCLFDKKQREKFTGGIKLGFEQGRPVNCSEYSDPKETPPAVTGDFSLSDRLKKACSSGYYGSHLYIFKDGIITHASSVQTWMGQGIQSLLEEASAKGARNGASLS